MRDRTRRIPFAGLILLVAAAATIAYAPARGKSGQPDADKIIARYVKAIGGKKAYLAGGSRVAEGTMSMPAAGISGALKVTAMSPDLLLVEIEIEGLGSVKEGYDGKVGWSIDPMTGPQVKSGKQLEQAADQAAYDGGLFPKDRYKTREVVGQVEFDGKSAWKLRLVSANDIETFAFFDVESGLLLGTQLTQETAMGAIPVTATMGDYKEFDGVLVPTRLVQDLGPAGKQIFELTRIESGGVDRSVFELPAEIKALVE